MSLIPFLTTWSLGWGIYRGIYRQNAALSPLVLGLTWLLGAGVIYGFYFVSIAFFRREPPPTLMILPAVVTLVDFIWFARNHPPQGWDAFYREPRLTLLLLAVIGIIILFTAVMGYASDTTSFWQGRAFALAQRPDYEYMLRVFPVHPDYPLVFTHQYQWQFTFSDSVLGTKLPTIGFFVATLCAVFSLLKDTRHPVRWVFLTAGLPLNFFLVPIGLADMPLGAYLITGICLVGYALSEDKDPQLKQQHRITVGLLLGLMTLVKTEGLLLLVCVCAALIYLAAWREYRREVWHLLLYVGIIAGVCIFSWRLVLWNAPPVYSDFSLSAFDLSRTDTIIKTILPILLNPISFAGLWLIFIVLLIMNPNESPLIWIPALLYIAGMIFAYLFSAYSPVEDHIVDSFERLLHQVMPLGMVYIARVMSSKR